MKLRYEEYCLNRQWEDPGRFPEGMEYDLFDDTAVHVLLKDRRTKQPVGTVRVVYADAAGATGPNLPMFDFAPAVGEKMSSAVSLDRAIELSRFTISRKFMRSAGNDNSGSMRAFPALALIKGALRATAFDDVDVVCFTTTQSLKRLLARSGCRFHDIGIRIEHRGTRIPLYRNLNAFLAELYTTSPAVWRYVTDDGDTWPLEMDALEQERRLLAS